MSEFTYIFRGRDMNESREQQQKTLEKWFAWFNELTAKGHLKGPGYPLAVTGKVVRDKKKGKRRPVR